MLFFNCNFKGNITIERSEYLRKGKYLVRIFSKFLMQDYLLRLINFFYPPFSKWLSFAVFTYLTCGAITICSSWITYFIAYNEIFDQKGIRLAIPYLPKLITAPTAALLLEVPITFLVGFTLNKYVVFSKSTLKGRIQILRYLSIVFVNFLANLAMIKFLVESFNIDPNVAKISATCILAITSFYSQKYFSFSQKE